MSRIKVAKRRCGFGKFWQKKAPRLAFMAFAAWKLQSNSSWDCFGRRQSVHIATSPCHDSKHLDLVWKQVKTEKTSVSAMNFSFCFRKLEKCRYYAGVDLNIYDCSLLQTASPFCFVLPSIRAQLAFRFALSIMSGRENSQLKKTSATGVRLQESWMTAPSCTHSSVARWVCDLGKQSGCDPKHAGTVQKTEVERVHHKQKRLCWTILRQFCRPREDEKRKQSTFWFWSKRRNVLFMFFSRWSQMESPTEGSISASTDDWVMNQIRRRLQSGVQVSDEWRSNTARRHNCHSTRSGSQGKHAAYFSQTTWMRNQENGRQLSRIDCCRGHLESGYVLFCDRWIWQ